MTLTQKLKASVLIGAIVGAGCGLVESVLWLARTPWWRAETPTIAVAMASYGLLNALVTSVWGLVARRMDPRAFQSRTFLFSVLAMGYLFVGFYGNRLWFPKLNSLPSLLFTGTLTVVCLLTVVALLRWRVRSSSPLSGTSGGVSRLWFVALGLVFVAGLAFVPPRRSGRNERMTHTPAASIQAERPNILLIVMDTTRADHLSCYGAPRSTSPNLDRLAQEGVLFEQASSAASWTLPSHASLFTGLYRSQHGTDWPHKRLDDHLTTLAELLSRHGYQTVGFSNNPWVSWATNFHQGFESFKDIRSAWRAWWTVNQLAVFQIKDTVYDPALHQPDAGAARTNRLIRRWFDRLYDPDRPFFLFINYVEAHFPYTPPEPYRSRFLQPQHSGVAEALALTNPSKAQALHLTAPPVRFDEATRQALSDLYDGEIGYLDMRIGQLLEELRARQLLDKTVVIVTSDHGESLGDHELFEHRFCVYETLLHVPLMVRYPAAFSAGVRVAQPVSLVDVMPTLIALLDLDASAVRATLPGQSWVSSSLVDLPERPILAEYLAPLELLPRYKRKPQPIDERYFTRDFTSLRQGPWKFILATDGTQELYDLSHDPDESDNLIATQPKQAKAMEAILHQQLPGLKLVGTLEDVQPMDEATHRQLRSLGYVQ